MVLLMSNVLINNICLFNTGKKGGALLSALHSNMQHGDPFVKSLVRHILNLVRTASGKSAVRYTGAKGITHQAIMFK